MLPSCDRQDVLVPERKAAKRAFCQKPQNASELHAVSVKLLRGRVVALDADTDKRASASRCYTTDHAST